MRRLLLVLLFAAMGTGKSYSQALVQTYVDRCTGQVHVFSVPMTGQTVVAFYNKSRTFTAQEFTDGTLQAWLEQTYQWWSALSPCSTNQANTTTTQQTTTQATSQATTAATNATQNTTTNATTGSTNTNSTATTGGTSSGDTSSGSTGSGTESGSSNSNSGSSSSDTGGTSGDGNSGDGGSSGDGGGSSGEEGSGGGEETKNEESNEQKSEESSEESSEEKEEVEKEESSEEEEEKKEESSEDSSEEEEKKEEKKKKLAPPVIAANLVTMSMLDGTLSQAASFGYSQSSLTGLDTYNVNGMLWSNLQQYSINLSKSHVFFNYDKPREVKIKNAFGEEEILGTVLERGSILKVQSISAGYMKMFTTDIITVGISDVFLGQKDNFWKGFAGGWAFTGMVMFMDEVNPLFTSAITVFGTKPFIVPFYKRLTVAPMLAYSATPLTVDLKTRQGYYDINGSYVIGSNFDFNLTQRFKANIGFTTIGSTIKDVPLSWAITVGSRFAF